MANEVSRLLRERHSDAPWAEKLHELGDIVATACLCHDLGNPPFGHSGEKTISTFFSEGRDWNSSLCLQSVNGPTS